MTIEAIVMRLDAALERFEAAPVSKESVDQRSAIARLLHSAEVEGYRLGLVTALPAERLHAVLEEQFGAACLDYFSAVVSGDQPFSNGTRLHPYDVALRTLGVPCECAVACASSEPERSEAERFGIPTCVHLEDMSYTVTASRPTRRLAWFARDSKAALATMNARCGA
ncbi:hypothetical protein LMG31841_05076 [Paraburkholderia saeva]|uniref:Haloacid dehalogenase n=1 Tax=Paraburkholderia saeva TaxID=2777537 RepID=A0A9N8S199_9BURK|nr:hypothetical protein LMG31841_05076 [Paraburkholderia saeva]